jgi:hypothetical protein
MGLLNSKLAIFCLASLTTYFRIFYFGMYGTAPNQCSVFFWYASASLGDTSKAYLLQDWVGKDHRPGHVPLPSSQFCIEQRLASAPLLSEDFANIAAEGAVPLVRHRDGQNDNSPEQLLNGGHHYDDVDRNMRRQLERQSRRVSDDGLLPRDRLHQIIIDKDMKRPTPMSWKK